MFADKGLEMTVDVGKVNLDEVEEKDADRRESNIWLRWCMSMWRRDQALKKERSILEYEV